MAPLDRKPLLVSQAINITINMRQRNDFVMTMH